MVLFELRFVIQHETIYMQCYLTFYTYCCCFFITLLIVKLTLFSSTWNYICTSN